jgi:hypothetical protein
MVEGDCRISLMVAAIGAEVSHVHIQNLTLEVSLTNPSQVSKNNSAAAPQARHGHTRSLNACSANRAGRPVELLVLRAERVGRTRLQGRLVLQGFDVWEALGMTLRGRGNEVVRLVYVHIHVCGNFILIRCDISASHCGVCFVSDSRWILEVRPLRALPPSTAASYGEFRYISSKRD